MQVLTDLGLKATPQPAKRFFPAFESLVEFVDKFHQLLRVLFLASSFRKFSPVGIRLSNHNHPPGPSADRT
jgi:hypothetical protein